MKKRRANKTIHLFLIIVLLLAAISPVFGNGGPPTGNPSDEKLIFDEDSGIALKEEWVTIDLTTEYEGRVEVRYILENLHRAEEDLDMLFIIPENSGNFEVFWKDEKVENIEELSYNNLPQNWKSTEPPTVDEPLSGSSLMIGEQYDYGRYGGAENYKGMAFSLDLVQGEREELTLSYPGHSGFYGRSEVINPVYYKTYYLTPALFWEGDTKVHLEFHLPEGDYAMDSNIPMESRGDGIYEATLEEIPEEEWRISYTSTSGLFFRTNYRTRHNGIVGIAMVLLLLISGYLAKKKDARFIWLSLLILPMFLLIRLHGAWTYIALFMILAPVVAILILWGLIHLYTKFKGRFLSGLKN